MRHRRWGKIKVNKVPKKQPKLEIVEFCDNCHFRLKGIYLRNAINAVIASNLNFPDIGNRVNGKFRFFCCKECMKQKQEEVKNEAKIV